MPPEVPWVGMERREPDERDDFDARVHIQPGLSFYCGIRLLHPEPGNASTKASDPLKSVLSSLTLDAFSRTLIMDYKKPLRL